MRNATHKLPTDLSIVTYDSWWKANLGCHTDTWQMVVLALVCFIRAVSALHPRLPVPSLLWPSHGTGP